MKVEQLKNKLIKEVIVYGAIIIIMIIVNSYVTKKVNGYKNQLASINSQISEIQSKLAYEQQQYAAFIKRYEGEFLNIPKSKLPDNNKKLNDDLVKAQVITKYVNDMVQKLDIFKPKLKIIPSNQSNIDEKGYGVSRSLLEINFKAKTDSFVYAFLKHLQSDEFEGYITLKSLEISLLGEPNRIYINKLIRTGNLLPLIEAKIYLDWYNYQDPNNKLTIKQ